VRRPPPSGMIRPCPAMLAETAGGMSGTTAAAAASLAPPICCARPGRKSVSEAYAGNLFHKNPSMSGPERSRLSTRSDSSPRPSCDSLVAPSHARSRPFNTKTDLSCTNANIRRRRTYRPTRISNPLSRWSTQIRGRPPTSICRQCAADASSHIPGSNTLNSDSPRCVGEPEQYGCDRYVLQ
jgi:hypothetical protein